MHALIVLYLLTLAMLLTWIEHTCSKSVYAFSWGGATVLCIVFGFIVG